MAMCVIAVVGVAPCQCFSLGANQTTSRPDFLNWSTLMLSPANTGRNNQRLTERVCMPGGARTGLECDARASNTRRLQSFK